MDQTSRATDRGSGGGGGGDDAPPFRYTAGLAGEIETRWQGEWAKRGTFRVPNPGQPGFDAARPKFYCLDMFPYPSGAGLHVGHPEGYTATDIVCRFMRMKGHNVLHPMGWDAFGLPAEQYAIQTGVHPAITTKKAINEFRRQLQRFGFCYDWDREVATIDPQYYKWTQWIFLRLYNAWFDPQAQSPAYPDGERRRGCARPIADLIAQLESGDLRVGPSGELVHIGAAAAGTGILAGEPVGTRRWHELTGDEQRALIDGQRLAYLDDMTVNWCPALGTVLANDEVIDGKSERGGHPVLRKPMRQWQFAITRYAQRLLDDLSLLDWPESTKTIQSEWIGRSEGAEIAFDVVGGTPLRGVTDRSLIARVAATPEQIHPRGFVGRDPYPPGTWGAASDVAIHRRDLPHLRMPDATYFVTWSLLDRAGDLTEDERALVARSLLHFEGARHTTYAFVVMSNHVHWLVKPAAGFDIDGVTRSVKHHTAVEINARRGGSGHLWDESFDHMVRDVDFLRTYAQYIANNPVKAGMVRAAEQYAHTYVGTEMFGEVRHAAERRATQGSLEVFTTRPDTLFGATYMVVAPEHEIVDAVLAGEIAVQRPHAERGGTRELVRAYVHAARNRSDVERMESKDKTGVDLGIDAINPATGEPIPVWVADYVLMGYGTGAIMAVPAHDERDWAFAKAFGLPIKQVVQSKTPAAEGACFVGEGLAVNSSSPELTIDGLPTGEAKRDVIEWLERTGRGRKRVNFKLRDWVFSRQRYWGEPFPIVYDQHGRHYPVSDASLPVILPELDDYAPVESEDPQPLLAKAGSWVHTTAGAAGVDPNVLDPSTPVRRETNTMPGSAGSSWYFLRYCDPKNDAAMIDGAVDGYWMGTHAAGAAQSPTRSVGVPKAVGGVDLYIGGSEHAVGHLLYARFWQKVLFDLGLVRTPEPFQRLFHQGMITSFAYERADKSLVPVDQVDEVREGEFVEKATGAKLKPIVAKMSKSLKNVVNPDDIIAQFGADTFRLYEMYMGPLEASKPWNTKDTIGCFRFLQRAWRVGVDEQTGALKLATTRHEGVERQLHKTIAKVDGDIPRLAFNTSIAAMMELVNAATSHGGMTKDQLERFALVLAPFAPHMAEELWRKLGHERSLADEPFPTADPAMLVEDQVEIPVSVNGKVRGKIVVKAGLDKPGLEAAAMGDAGVQALIAGKTVNKVIVVPGKMVNLVVAG